MLPSSYLHAQSYPLKAASQPVFSSNSTWRATAHTYCRPIPFPVSKGGERPQSPHLSWLFKRYLLLGVQSAVIPAGVDLLSPRVGRAIAVKHGAARFYGLLHVQSTPIALYPASSEIPFVPPFPGVSPAWIYDPSHPESCFVDGTLGAFDHRHYAQLFNHRCPWGPFHDNPLSLDYHASSCEIQTVGAFFIWNQPGNPTRGGRWSKQRLLDLFRQRDRYEGEFHALMHEPVADEFQKKFRDATQRARDYDLPFYDPLEYTETLQWGSFGEGRDRLAHTLRYTADMKAIVRWYQAECAFQNFRGDSTTLPPPNPDIMGTWAPTIDTKRRWTFLMHSCVPIYMIARIPSGHPLLNQAIPGNLDADERYRKNEYDVEHSLQEEWHAPLCNTFESFPLLPLETASYHLPESLIAPQSVPCRDNQKSTSYRLTWRSCIFLDDTIPRILCDEDISQKDWSQLRHKCDSSLFPFLPPSYRLLRADTDRHPLLDVIGSCKGHGNRIQRYEEVYDAEIDGYYPRKREHVTSISNYLRDTALYRFFFEREGVEILSGYPFPGRSLSFGRVNYDSSEEDKEKDATAVLQIPSRRYFFHRPEGYTPDDNTPLPEPVFTWQPLDGSDTAPINQAPIVACRYPVVPTMLIDGDGDPRLQLMTRDIAGNDYQFTIMDDPILALELKLITFKAKMSRQSEASKVFEDYVTELSTIAPVSEEERESHFFRARRLSEFARQRDPNHVLPHVRTPEELEEDIRHYDYLSQQRTRLHTNLSQRLFRPRFSDRLIAPKLTSWQIYGGTDRDVCFPVRIASLDGNVATETLFSMLYKMLDIDPHEVVVFSTYLEADSTRTFDLGMRFAEDAVLVRLFLHGTEIDGRYIEVQFLRGMAGKLSATGYPTNPKEHERRDWDLRMRRVEGAMITTGIDADLLGDAWAVRRALSRVKFRANPTHTTQALIQGYRENAVPVQNISCCWPSMITDKSVQEWTASAPKFCIVQETGAGTGDIQNLGPASVDLSFAMADEMRWELPRRQGGRAAGARGPNASINRRKHRPIPKHLAANTSSSGQRRDHMRAIKATAERLRSCWRAPGLELPAFSPEEHGSAMLPFFEQLWDWQDHCLAIMERFRAETTERYDYSSFEGAFGSLARLDGVRGDEYSLLVAALARRASASHQLLVQPAPGVNIANTGPAVGGRGTVEVMQL